MSDHQAEVEQLERIADSLEIIASQYNVKYTLTGAADWEILLVMGGCFIALIIYIWQATIAYIGKVETSDGKTREVLFSEIEKHAQSNERDFDKWEAMMKDCQNDCCPPRVGHDGGKNHG